MRRKYLLTGIFISTLFVLFFLTIFSGSGSDIADDNLDKYREVNEFVDDNEACFKCHGEKTFALPNDMDDRVLTRHMCPDYSFKREAYYDGNHKSFACTDCHSPEYESFPHPLEPRLEEHWGCLDCHGYDEDYAKYQFEKIEEEYLQSVHHLANDEFSCWKCHPHSYHISIRNTENLRETIAYDNAICLSCHADFSQFELLTDRESINLTQTHDWLPNEAIHFQNVRCIECHTQINDSILVAHMVLPKEQAVRLCSECHSSNSLLMHTLYKFESKEKRDEYGFINAVILNEAYVIGANRNLFLVLLSFIIFGLTILGIMAHAIMRIKHKV